MKNEGEVLAWDRGKKKVEQMENLFGQQGIKIAKPMTVNAVQATKKGFKKEFDRILLDAPCSGLGLRPYLKHKFTFLELQKTATYQKQLLQEAVQLLKDGGILVRYSFKN